jgi:hypothetical protein
VLLEVSDPKLLIKKTLLLDQTEAIQNKRIEELIAHQLGSHWLEKIFEVRIIH